MRKIAIYGKGGIGKSTISSNLTAALSARGLKVIQIGCDPKHDSTRLLGGGAESRTVLAYMRDVPPEDRRLEDIVVTGRCGCLCVEAGGPEPGIGCAGRGIISAFELLHGLGIDDVQLDMIIYDVLGDVVCGGFAVPLRNGYADTVYIVTSGEFMSIYAANNILRGTANYDPDRIGGLIFNSRGDPEERERVMRFSDAVGVPVVAELPRSAEFLSAEESGTTVVESLPGSELAAVFSGLTDAVCGGRMYSARYLDENELESVVLGKRREASQPAPVRVDGPAVPPRRYMSRNVERREALHGCAFSGAAAVTASVEGLTTILHSPRGCAQYTFQMTANTVRRAAHWHETVVAGFADPDVLCTDLGDGDMVFGGTRRLEDLLESAVSSGRRDIAVITSCPAGIIGDDVSSAIGNVLSRHPGTTIADIREDGVIKGDFMQGVIDASVVLMKTFAADGVPKTHSVNLVGVKTQATNCTRNRMVVASLLEPLGIGVNCGCVGDTTVDGLRGMRAAGMNLMMSPDRFARALRDFMNDEYDIPFAENVVRPGLRGTEAWVREVAGRFGAEAEADALIADIRREYALRISRLERTLRGKTVCITCMHRDIDWVLEVVDAVGMRLLWAAVLDLSDYLNDYDIRSEYPDVEILMDYDIGNVSSRIRELGPDLLLTTARLDAGPETRQSFVTMTEDAGPFAGPEFAETWVRELNAPASEGWREDVLRT